MLKDMGAFCPEKNANSIKMVFFFFFSKSISFFCVNGDEYDYITALYSFNSKSSFHTIGAKFGKSDEKWSFSIFLKIFRYDI